MPNITEETLNEADWVSTLKRLEKVGGDLRKSEAAMPPEQREPLKVRFVDLQNKLPAGVLLAIRPRLDRGQPLIASATGGRCGACFVAMPRGDHTAVLAGAKIVPCQYCGVLLYADNVERRRVAALRETREKRGGRRT